MSEPEVSHGRQVVRQITRAVATDLDTLETSELVFKEDSPSLFLAEFPAGDDMIQLRLDWSDIDAHGHPTLDAHFKDPQTGKHRRLTGKRRDAHRTEATGQGDRTYEWRFQYAVRRVTVAITWSLKPEAASASVSASPAVLIRKSGSAASEPLEER